MSVNHFEFDLIKYVLVLKKLLEKKTNMIHTIYGIFSFFITKIQKYFYVPTLL